MASLNGRKVEDIEVDGVNREDHPKYCDAYFSKATFADTGEELTDEQLMTLTENNPELLNESAYLKAVGA